MSWIDDLSILSQLKSCLGTTPDKLTYFTIFIYIDKGLIETG
uniref:Uncharacterized protein n=1 Tax=viral metagenome TaxID=1070528 RepID=A0A6C0JTN8_9ZZZZ